jgi:pilus assembly protein Flp/PilA
MPMPNCLRRFLADESGATTLEYAMIGFFLSIVILGATRIIGTKLSAAYYLPVANNLT